MVMDLITATENKLNNLVRNNQHSRNKLDEHGIVQIRNRICAIITIASKCNQPITYEEIALMLPPAPEPINAEEFIQADPAILKQITVQNGLIVLRVTNNFFRSEHITSEFRLRKCKRQNNLLTPC